jgi:O-succinylbenzoate synthase
MMSSPQPFVPFGSPPELTATQAANLTLALVQAMKESTANIQLPDVASAGFSMVVGIIKGKFGMLATIPELVWAIANRDWTKVQGIVFDQVMSIASLDDLLSLAEAIKTVDNGRAYASLMKNIDYKRALNKFD